MAQNVFSQGLVNEIRNRFACVDNDPFSGKRVFFENAGGTLKLKSILETLEKYTALPDNAGRINPASKKVDEVIAQGKKDIAILLGAKSGRIIAEQSTTGMIFRILGTVAREHKGSNMVVSNLDHPSSYDATHIMCTRHGLDYRVAQLDPKTGIVPAESVLKLVDKNTVAVTIIHASNILGTKNDVKLITKCVREKNPNTFVILDGAQHASHGKIDVEDYGADAWIFVPYKTYSKIGISFACISDRLANLPHDNLLGKPKDAWDLGTRETAAYACMSNVLEYFNWLGSHFTGSKDPRTVILEAMLAIEQYELELLKSMLHGTDRQDGMLKIPKVSLIGDFSSLDQHEAIIAFNIAGADDTEVVVNYFEKNGIRLHNRVSDAYSKHTLDALGEKECVRVSLCHYNTVEEINLFLKLLKQY
ncbi:MAG: aminotransferase class V-fold PLP-dependent enzyme [Sedimentisphaerales bacterium]